METEYDDEMYPFGMDFGACGNFTARVDMHNNTRVTYMRRASCSKACEMYEHNDVNDELRNKKTLRLLEPQGCPEVIECDGRKYFTAHDERSTCRIVPISYVEYEEPSDYGCSCCGAFIVEGEDKFCHECGRAV